MAQGSPPQKWGPSAPLWGRYDFLKFWPVFQHANHDLSQNILRIFVMYLQSQDIAHQSQRTFPMANFRNFWRFLVHLGH